MFGLLKCTLNGYFETDVLGGDYIVPVCRYEISLHPAGADLTLRLQ